LCIFQRSESNSALVKKRGSNLSQPKQRTRIRAPVSAIIGGAIAFHFLLADSDAAGEHASVSMSAINTINYRLFPANVRLACPAGQSDGRRDNSPCVQSVVDAACHADPRQAARLVLLCPGQWKFHDITVRCDGVHIKGAGPGGDAPHGRSGSTNVDCGGMKGHCIQFIPSGFPARFRMRGGSVEGMRFFNSGNSG
jgi:hypothetical protein